VLFRWLLSRHEDHENRHFQGHIELCGINWYLSVPPIFLFDMNCFPVWEAINKMLLNIYEFSVDLPGKAVPLLRAQLELNLYVNWTNKCTLDGKFITLFYILLLLHVSTLTHHLQGALIRCLLSYVNVLLQSWWCFV
jgi:hypothetical protein